MTQHNKSLNVSVAYAIHSFAKLFSSFFITSQDKKNHMKMLMLFDINFLHNCNSFFACKWQSRSKRSASNLLLRVVHPKHNTLPTVAISLCSHIIVVHTCLFYQNYTHCQQQRDSNSRAQREMD